MNKTKDEKVKKIHFGILLDEIPREDERLRLLRLDDNQTVRTSVVESFVSFYEDRIWVVETQNSIYVLKKE